MVNIDAMNVDELNALRSLIDTRLLSGALTALEHARAEQRRIVDEFTPQWFKDRNTYYYVHSIYLDESIIRAEYVFSWNLWIRSTVCDYNNFNSYTRIDETEFNAAVLKFLNENVVAKDCSFYIQKNSDDHIRDLKIIAWAMSMANEMDAVPEKDRIDRVCELFGPENRELYLDAISRYSGYSYNDITRIMNQYVLEKL